MPVRSGLGQRFERHRHEFGPFSSSAVIAGLFLSDATASGAGGLLWFGTLPVPRTVLEGDSLKVVIAPRLGLV
jgi:hypothetical protein